MSCFIVSVYTIQGSLTGGGMVCLLEHQVDHCLTLDQAKTKLIEMLVKQFLELEYWMSERPDLLSEIKTWKWTDVLDQLCIDEAQVEDLPILSWSIEEKGRASTETIIHLNGMETLPINPQSKGTLLRALIYYC